MPLDNLHMTALEITHSRTAEEIRDLVDKLGPYVQRITDYTLEHRVRLIKPVIGFDASGLALCFLPAAGESPSAGRKTEDDDYTYQHLRKELYDIVTDTGLQVDSRYVVPSAHLTIARFIDSKDFTSASNGCPVDREKEKRLLDKIDEISDELRKELWPSEDSSVVPAGGEWIVGQEKGLDARQGRLWYGGGETIHLGKGF